MPDPDVIAKYERLRELILVLWVPLRVREFEIRLTKNWAGECTTADFIFRDYDRCQAVIGGPYSGIWHEMLVMEIHNFDINTFREIVFPGEPVTAQMDGEYQIVVTRDSSITAMLEVS